MASRMEGPILLLSHPGMLLLPPPRTPQGSLGKINDFMKLRVLCEPLSGVQRMRSGPGAGTGGMKPMARDGGGEAHQHRGDPLSPTSQMGAAGSPPKPSAPLGGGLGCWV